MRIAFDSLLAPSRSGTNLWSLLPRELAPLLRPGIPRLVAEGNTNREIAGVLVVSHRTVKRHLDNIFAKLDVSSRTAAAASGLRSGLV